MGQASCGKFFYFLEHAFGEPAGIGAAADILQGFELPDEVRPAKLSEVVLVIGTVGGMVVARYGPREGFSQDKRQNA